MNDKDRERGERERERVRDRESKRIPCHLDDSLMMIIKVDKIQSVSVEIKCNINVLWFSMSFWYIGNIRLYFLNDTLKVVIILIIKIMSRHQHGYTRPSPATSSIIHRFWYIFKATSCIDTELFYVGSSWLSNLCLSM